MIIFILVLSCLVVIHELGHFLMARLHGVRVEKFALGFGPTLLQFKGKQTTYALCLIPLGGFVKMAAENPDEKREGASWEFPSKTVGQRMSIVVAGPALNYLLGLILFIIIFMMGSPVYKPVIGEIRKDSPAERAGIQVNDTIKSVNQMPITTWDDLVQKIQKSTSDELVLEIDRAGAMQQIQVKKEYQQIKNIFGQTVQQKLIGIVPSAQNITFVKYPFFEAVGRGVQKIVMITVYTYQALFRVIIGVMPLKQAFTGPVGIYYLTKEASQVGFVYLLSIIAMLSTSLAIFNLLPLPVVDGGQVVFMIIEKLRGRPLSLKVQERIAMVGFYLLILLGLLIFYNDFVRFGIIDKLMGLVKKVFVR